MTQVTTSGPTETVHLAKQPGGDAIIDLTGNVVPRHLEGDAAWIDSDLPSAAGVDWAISFDGTGDYALLGDQEPFYINTDDFTVAAWV